MTVLPACTNVNVALNNDATPLENRRHNQTRAEAAAPVEFSALPGAGGEEHAVPRPLPTGDNGWFVGLALSGGGSRSANFAAACMFQLERVGLLQHVGYISSVSGGSLPAAYYCAGGREDWNPGEVQRRLTHAFASDLIGQVILPWNAVAFAVSDWDRTDVLAGVFNKVLFSRHGKTLTFADLRRDRPRLLINSTDLQSGHRFVFSNEAFDDINSDLSRYPLAYAVAASSAVPVVLHPVTLRDYSTAFRQFRHLVDGGIVDNLGAQTLLDAYEAQIDEAERRHLPDPHPRGAVFVVVDAHTNFNAQLSAMGDLGLVNSLKTATGLSSTALLNRASSATLAEMIVNNAPAETTAQQLRDAIDRLTRDGFIQMKDRRGRPVEVIYMTLQQVNGMSDLPFEGFTESLNGIGTYFNIDPTEAYHLYQAADLLARRKFDSVFREVLEEIQSKQPPENGPQSAQP